MGIIRRVTAVPNNTAQKRKKHWSTAALALVTTGALVFSGCAGPNHNGAGNDLPLAQGPRSAVLPNNDPDVIIDKPVQNLPVTGKARRGRST